MTVFSLEGGSRGSETSIYFLATAAPAASSRGSTSRREGRDRERDGGETAHSDRASNASIQLFINQHPGTSGRRGSRCATTGFSMSDRQVTVSGALLSVAAIPCTTLARVSTLWRERFPRVMPRSRRRVIVAQESACAPLYSIERCPTPTRP